MTSETNQPSRPAVSPFCQDLCSKKILVTPGSPMTDADVLDRSNHCWCSQTMTILGPDREPAHPGDCRQGRECFRSPFESLL